MPASFTGCAGVYFVAAKLQALGIPCAITLGNAPGIDLLVSASDGKAQLAIQVKTTSWATRERGRGERRRPSEYQWDIGWNCARLHSDRFLFALVDLKGFDDGKSANEQLAVPDVFFVPSKFIVDYFAGGGPPEWKRARLHVAIQELEPYKNNWAFVADVLAG